MKTKTLLYPLLFIFLTASQSCKKDSTTSVNSTAGSSDEQLAADIAVSDSSLLCYLPFKGNLKDKSGHGNNGVLNGTISYVPDRLGNPSAAASFAASNSWIEIPEKDFVGMKHGTIALQFYPSSTNQQELVSKMSYDAAVGSAKWYQSFTLSVESNGTIGFDLRKDGYCAAYYGGGWNPTMFSNATVKYNKWNFVAITFDDSVQKMYLNGTVVASNSKVVSPICEGEPIRLGVWWQVDPIFFTGNMDEVRIYNRVLSEKELERISKK